MKSIIHISADTPEELRQELLSWLEHEINARATEIQMGTLVRDRAAARARHSELQSVFDFWRGIIIDKKEG